MNAASLLRILLSGIVCFDMCWLLLIHTVFRAFEQLHLSSVFMYTVDLFLFNADFMSNKKYLHFVIVINYLYLPFKAI